MARRWVMAEKLNGKFWSVKESCYTVLIVECMVVLYLYKYMYYHRNLLAHIVCSEYHTITYIVLSLREIFLCVVLHLQ